IGGWRVIRRRRVIDRRRVVVGIGRVIGIIGCAKAPAEAEKHRAAAMPMAVPAMPAAMRVAAAMTAAAMATAAVATAAMALGEDRRRQHKACRDACNEEGEGRGSPAR